MIEQILGQAFLRMIPQWYQAGCGPNPTQLLVGGHKETFYSRRPLTPKLWRLKDAAERELPQWISLFSQEIPLPPGLLDIVQESLALQWLKLRDKSIDWNGFMRYIKDLTLRTYENDPVTVNLVVSRGKGRDSLIGHMAQKYFDPLGSGPLTFFRVDPKGRFLGYEEIGWDQITPARSYPFYPEFLHPFSCILEEDEFSIHLTEQGDVIVLDKDGLLAARRKGQWKLYDVKNFKNSITDIIGKYRAGSNLFGIVYDLSFRRHGALLVFDPEGNVLPHVVNPESLIQTEGRPSSHPIGILAPVIEDIRLADEDSSAVRKRLLIELASLDGAVIFDDSRLLAVGAMIAPHEKVAGQIGARSTAAASAYHWGGYPIKVSSDGDVTVYFQSRGQGSACDAQLRFL